ncbi:MAG: polysaccharide biosynthesis/export family protein [Lentisphaerae bacterium]|nr:polysaccharide biosynthesis/export family protein [Lentisphaerota bacterium]
MKTPPFPCTMLRAALAAAGILVLAGCRTASEPPLEDLPAVAETPAREETVALGPGDVLEIKFFYAPELDDMQTVRPDGRISLQLVGDVDVRGLSPAALRDALKSLYEPFMEKAEIAVIVRELNSRAVFVGGAVSRPGRLAMPGRLTVLGAVIEAGGLDSVTADPGEVAVIRQHGAAPAVEIVDLRAALAGGAPHYLQPMDIVYVPRTEIANFNQWVDQHINQLVPQFGFTYFRSSRDGRESIGIDTSR